MSEEPWFRMRPSKFMAGCRGLNANEVKVYISLICRIMEHGEPVDDDAEILATYCEMRPTSFASALERLIRLKKLIRTDDGQLTNAFCDSEIEWRNGQSEKASAAGKASAKAREKNRVEHTAASYSDFPERVRAETLEKAQEKQCDDATDVEPALNQKKEIEIQTEKKKELAARKRAELALFDAEFDRVYPHYPKQVCEAVARKRWRIARKKRSFEEIAGPLREFIRATKSSDPNFLPNFGRWLEEERWLDDPAHAANRPQTSTEDLRRLGTITSSDDLAALFSTPQLRIAK